MNNLLNLTLLGQILFNPIAEIIKTWGINIARYLDAGIFAERNTAKKKITGIISNHKFSRFLNNCQIPKTKNTRIVPK